MNREYIFGVNPAFEVILSNKRKIYKAFISAKKNPKINKLVELLKRNNISISFTDKGELFKQTGTKKHQGVVLEVDLFPYSDFDSMCDCKKLLLLDNIEDPHNLGAILRSAEIFGFKHILLSERGTPNIYPTVVKVSAGATEHLNICKSMSANTYVKKLIDKEFAIVSLDEKADIEISSVKGSLNQRKFLLVIGGEDKSIGQFIINSSDYVVKMNQFGRINSLNASVAAGIAMYMLSKV